VNHVGPDVHHRDIVSAALASYEEELRRDRVRATARLKSATS
jgi:hypothetical protein